MDGDRRSRLDLRLAKTVPGLCRVKWLVGGLKFGWRAAAEDGSMRTMLDAGQPRMSSLPLTRREALRSAACGFGSLALAGLAAQHAGAATNPLAARPTHFRPRAKRVIFLFMQGGVSHVDSFDHKPLLAARDGELLDFDDARKIANSGKREASTQRVMKPLWKFARHGQSGRWGSDLFPEMCRHVDKMTFIHSLHTEGIAHGPATLFLHCGATQFIRPSVGAWVNYGLGTENENLPGFVSISPSSGNGGPRNFGNAFLPAIYQGTAMGKAGGAASEAVIRNLANPLMDAVAQRRQFDLLQAINAEQLGKKPGDTELEAVGAQVCN